MSYKVTLKAESDIIAIYIDGVSAFGVNQAEIYHAQMEEVFELIATTPYIARERREIDPPIRIHPYKAHIILYKIEQDGSVLIIRVCHAKEDWIKHSYDTP